MLQVKETTMIVVEYPRRLSNLVRDRVGPLSKVQPSPQRCHAEHRLYWNPCVLHM